MELTIEFWCKCEMGNGSAQVITMKIRRGQRKPVECGYCGSTIAIIQGNRKT